jgi:hypothetical protein
MPKGGNTLSRNPNICASCSSLSDGMGDTDPMEELSSVTTPTRDSREALKEPVQSKPEATAGRTR